MTDALHVEPGCPECGGKMWNNTLTKRNPKAPDWKCRDKGCKGVIWPEKGKGNIAATVQAQARQVLDLEEYGEPMPGKHDGPPAKLQPQGTGSHKGNGSWLDEVFHAYAACFAEAGQYTTDPKIQPLVAAHMLTAGYQRKQ